MADATETAITAKSTNECVSARGGRAQLVPRLRGYSRQEEVDTQLAATLYCHDRGTGARMFVFYTFKPVVNRKVFLSGCVYE